MKKIIIFTTFCISLLAIIEYSDIKAQTDDTPVIGEYDDQSDQSSSPQVVIIDPAEYPNYYQAQDKLNTAFATDQPLAREYSEEIIYSPLDNTARDNYVSALNYFHQFFTQDVPTTIDAATNQSNEIVSTIQHMIDLCIGNLKWLSDTILTAVFNPTTKENPSPVIITEGNDETNVPKQPKNQTLTPRGPYIQNYQQLLQLADNYDKKWIKPTGQYVTKNWKSTLYDPFIAKCDALVIYTTLLILEKLKEASDTTQIPEAEYLQAKAGFIDAAQRMITAKYASVPNAAFEEAWNVLWQGTTDTAQDVWNKLNTAFGWIAINYATKLFDQMAPEDLTKTISSISPEDADTKLNSELDNIIGSNNENIKKLDRAQQELYLANSAFNCVDSFAATKPLSCSEKNLLAAETSRRLKNINDIKQQIDSARKPQKFSDKAAALLSGAISRTSGEYWLSAHLFTVAQFLLGLYYQKQAQNALTTDSFKLPKELSGDFTTLTTTLRTAGSAYEKANYSFSSLQFAGSIQFTNGPVLPQAWATYPTDAYAVYDFMLNPPGSSIVDNLIDLFENMIPEAYSFIQSNSFNDAQNSFLVALNAVQTIDALMQKLQAKKGYKTSNPLAWYDTLTGTNPLTQYLAKLIINYWISQTNTGCTKEKGCDSKQTLDYALYTLSINSTYPYLTDDQLKTLNTYIIKSADQLLNTSQTALQNAQTLDANFAENKHEAQDTKNPQFTENAVAVGTWDMALNSAQLAFDLLLAFKPDVVIKNYFDCLNAYYNSNVVAMHPDHLVRQTVLAYKKYAAALTLEQKKITSPESSGTIIASITSLLQPLWNDALKAVQQQTSAEQKSEADYNKQLTNLNKIGTWHKAAETLINMTQQDWKTIQKLNTAQPLVKKEGSTYSAPLLGLPVITLTDATIDATRAKLYQNYGLFLFKTCLDELWDKSGNRKPNNALSQEAAIQAGQDSATYMTSFMPVKLQTAAQAFAKAHDLYAQAATSNQTYISEIEQLGSLINYAQQIFTTELTSITPLVPTKEFDSYLSQDMAGNVYTRYLLTSWFLPIPQELADYDNYVASISELSDTIKNAPDDQTLKDSLKSLYNDLIPNLLTDIFVLKLGDDSLKIGLHDTIIKLMKNGTQTDGSTSYKLTVTVGEYATGSYALFIGNYPAWPTQMNSAGKTSVEPATDVACISSLANYEKIEKLISNATPDFIKNFVDQRKASLIKLCRSTLPSAAYIFYKQAACLMGDSVSATIKKLINAETVQSLTLPTNIKSLDCGTGPNLFQTLQDSSLKEQCNDAMDFAAAAQDAPNYASLNVEDNQALGVDGGYYVAGHIAENYIDFLQKYLVGNCSADRYRSIFNNVAGVDKQSAFVKAQFFYDSASQETKNDTLKKDALKRRDALFKKQAQLYLKNAVFYETNHDYITAAINLNKVQDILAEQDAKTAQQIGLVAIRDIFTSAAEKFMTWYTNRNNPTTGQDPNKTALLDSLINYTWVSSLGAKSDDQSGSKQRCSNDSNCSGQFCMDNICVECRLNNDCKNENAICKNGKCVECKNGDDWISAYRKKWNISIACRPSGSYNLCKRTKTDCSTVNPSYQEQLLDRVNPDVNTYLCTFMKDTCYSDLSDYMYNSFVKSTTPDSGLLKKLLTNFVDNRITNRLTTTADGTVTVTTASTPGGEDSSAIGDDKQKLSALQEWASKMVGTIITTYAQFACASKETDTSCRTDALTDLTTELAERKSELAQNIGQFFRGSAKCD